MIFHKYKVIILSCIIFFTGHAFTSHVNAKEFWLSPSSQSSKLCTKKECECSNQNTCVLNRYLLTQLQAGDTVLFKKGIYPSFEIENLHGTKKHPITFNGSFSVGKAEISQNPKNKRDFIEVKKSSHIKLTGFVIKGAPRAAIRINNSHNITVENNHLSKSGTWGIFTNHSNYFAASNNIILGPAKQHGIYHSNSGDNVKLIANFIKDFNGCGIHINGDLTMGGASGVTGDGVISNVEIAQNYISGNGLVGGSAINLDGVENANIINNIMIKNKAAGISIFKADGGAGSAHVNVTSNLIIMTKGSKWVVNIKNAGEENTFNNNIMISQDSFRGIYDVLPVNLKKKNMPFTANNNIYGFGRNFIALNDEHYLPLDEWQSDYKNDKDSTKLFYKYVITNNGKLSQPLGEIAQERKIPESNPYLSLLF